MFALKRCLVSVSRTFQGVCSRRMSSMALVVPATKKKDLPDGISLQMLDERHDISQIRGLLARAFVANNEPIVHVLGEQHYPSLSTAERIPLIEQRFKNLFSKESLLDKVEGGLSIVAVKNNDTNQLVSVAFVEKYRGDIYKSASSVYDPLCEAGLNLMRTVHEKAIPELQCHKPENIAFVSHAATHPEYQSLGIFEHICDTSRLLIGEKGGLGIVYCVTTAQRLTKYLMHRYGFQVIAEVLYKDYEENGQRVFEKISDNEVSAKALITYL